MSMIKIEHLRKEYPNVTPLQDVSVEINKGDVISIIGPSGTGKSTLLNLMAGIEKLTKGEILIKGQSVGKMSENKLAKFRQENLGFVFQSYNLIGSMTALENVEFPLVFKRVPAKKRHKMAVEMLKAGNDWITPGGPIWAWRMWKAARRGEIPRAALEDDVKYLLKGFGLRRLAAKLDYFEKM